MQAACVASFVALPVRVMVLLSRPASALNALNPYPSPNLQLLTRWTRTLLTHTQPARDAHACPFALRTWQEGPSLTPSPKPTHWCAVAVHVLFGRGGLCEACPGALQAACLDLRLCSPYTLQVLASFCLHLTKDQKELSAVCKALAGIASHMVVATPNHRPDITVAMGWELLSEHYTDSLSREHRVRVRLYRSLLPCVFTW